MTVESLAQSSEAEGTATAHRPEPSRSIKRFAVGFAVVKLSGSDGSELLRAVTYGSNPNHQPSGAAKAVAVDAAGHPVAAGVIYNSDTGSDFIVVNPGVPAGPQCGDGVVEPGEDCDDGNTADGDCCSATCQFEPAGTACGGGCDPGTCDGAGVCQPG